MGYLKGTHGTCRTFAQSIVKDGFKRFCKGRRGSGVYFWAYDSQEFYAHQLAIDWWEHARSLGRYKKTDSRCAIVYVKLLKSDENYLDLERLELKETIIKGFNEVFNHLVKENHHSRAKASQLIYDMFIGEIEQESGCSFDIVHARIYSPIKRYDIELTGHPNCYLVRNVACILIERVETP